MEMPKEFQDLAQTWLVQDNTHCARYGKKLGRLFGVEIKLWDAYQAGLAREVKLVEALSDVKAAMGDRLLAKGPLSKPYAHKIMDTIDKALKETGHG